MAYEELKARQSVVWGNGPYQRVTETIADLQHHVTDSLQPEAGIEWLGLACGTGAVPELAAARGASVTGLDLAPALIETAKERAEEQGLEIDYVVGDCENTGFDDGKFDVISSTCGIMFAPDHEAVASELARITKPGGRIGLVNWTPGPGVADLFRIMAPFQPAPPPSNPFEWGDEDNVRRLLGDAFDLDLQRGVSTLKLESGDEYWDLFSTSYGPTKTLAESLGDRREELQAAWSGFFEENNRENGGIVHRREYLLVLGRRR